MTINEASRIGRVKSAPVRVKKVGEDDGLLPGEFEAIVSVFGNKDSYGDIVKPGAFKETLAEWADSGDPIPIYYSHRMDDPDYNIGEVKEAREVKEAELGYPHPAGLWVKGVVDLEDPSPTSKAPQVYRLMKGRRLTQFSFSYDVVDGQWVDETKDGEYDGHYSLDRVKLYEIGPTPIGANQSTELLGVKALTGALLDGVKAGRVLSSKNETTLREARDAIDAVLASLDKEDDADKASSSTESTSQEQPPVKSEEPEGANDEEPKAKRMTNDALARLRMAESSLPPDTGV